MTNWNEYHRPRRLTPAISALAAFEAVVRCESFTAAAEELALTQSAVSRQVSGLEELIGVALLEKNRRRHVVATPSGAYYAEQVRQILWQLTAATTEAIALGDRGRVLRLGIPPTFGSLWLIPRIPSFFKIHPDISIEFSTHLPSRPSSGIGDLHARIDFATAPASDAEWEELLRLKLLPVATEQIATAIQLEEKAALAHVHLLVHTTEQNSWKELLDDPKLACLRSLPLLKFENYTMLLQAASRGLGIALAPMELIESEVAAKRLTPLLQASIKSRITGYLVYNPEIATYPPLVAFRSWLLEELNADRPSAQEEADFAEDEPGHVDQAALG